VLYLLSLRLVPVFPFFSDHLVMGLTPMRALPTRSPARIGILPGTIVYVNAGTQLARCAAPRRKSSRRRCWARLALFGRLPLGIRQRAAGRWQPLASCTALAAAAAL